MVPPRHALFTPRPADHGKDPGLFPYTRRSRTHSRNEFKRETDSMRAGPGETSRVGLFAVQPEMEAVWRCLFVRGIWLVWLIISLKREKLSSFSRLGLHEKKIIKCVK